MKSKIYSLAALAFLFGQSTALADVTLQISQISVGRASGFANQAGTPTNGMGYGVVVSTSSSAFAGGSYDVFDPTVNQFLKVGGVNTDDYYVTSGLSTVTSTATGGDPGGVGSMTTINPVPFGGLTNISAGDPFQLIWFDGTPGAGTFYGMLGNQSVIGEFDIPADNAVYSVAPFFAGGTADPAKAASLQFAAIPEPSRMMLLGFGLVGLCFRRRR